MFKTVGVIGSAPLGAAIAGNMAAAGPRLLIADAREPFRLASLVSKCRQNAFAVTPSVAAGAELVILAIPVQGVPVLAHEVEDWLGTVVVDATSQDPTVDGNGNAGGENSTEWVGRQMPGATMIKAFNAMRASHVRRPSSQGVRKKVIFYAGDDRGACTRFAEFIDLIGFAPVYLGTLRDRGRLEHGGSAGGLRVTGTTDPG